MPDHLVDRSFERPTGDRHEAGRLVVDLADRDRHRGVGVPPLDDRPAVDRQDVTLLEHDVGARDAVHDDVVG
jgi:hypothetical protein